MAPPPYVLRRSARSRRLRITIDPEHGLVVTVPLATRRGWAHPEAVIDEFLREREPWIRRHLDAQSRQRAELAARGGLADGAAIRYRGDLHRLRVTAASSGRRSTVGRVVTLAGPELHVGLARARSGPAGAGPRGWFREQARFAIDATIADHAAALRVGPRAVALRDPRSRWGSASREGRLMFSWRLVLAPPEALETVVVHELAHLRVFGHGPRFWAVVASRRPDHVDVAALAAGPLARAPRRLSTARPRPAPGGPSVSRLTDPVRAGRSTPIAPRIAAATARAAGSLDVDHLVRDGPIARLALRGAGGEPAQDRARPRAARDPTRSGRGGSPAGLEARRRDRRRRAARAGDRLVDDRSGDGDDGRSRSLEGRAERGGLDGMQRVLAVLGVDRPRLAPGQLADERVVVEERPAGPSRQLAPDRSSCRRPSSR